MLIEGLQRSIISVSVDVSCVVGVSTRIEYVTPALKGAFPGSVHAAVKHIVESLRMLFGRFAALAVSACKVVPVIRRHD